MIRPSHNPLRVAIQQPALPRYRVPLFRALAKRTSLNVRIAYGDEDPALENVSPTDMDVEFVSVRRMQLPITGTLFWHSAQWSMANSSTTDVLVLTGNTRYLSLLPAMFRARIRNIPVVLWGHGYSKSPTAWRNFLRMAFAHFADAIVLYDKRTAEKFTAAGYPTERLFVAPNGLDVAPIDAARNKWLADPGGLQAFRTKHELNGGPILLHVSRLIAENRLDVAIEALVSLRRSHPNMKLAIVGSGDAERRRLEVLARTCEVSDAVLWVGPLYEEDQIAPWMLSATAFVYPANAGLSLIHAFNYGLPAVVAAPLAAHNPEINAVRDGANALVASSLLPEDFAQTCSVIVQDPACRARLSKEALATSRESFNIEAMASAFVACFEAVTNVDLSENPNPYV